MPRTLPWLNGSSTNRSTHLKPKKSQKALFSDSDDDTPSLSTKPALKQAVPSKAGRTPSTSPPPAPPTEEFMHEGLDRDDIYIMVEDEFHAIAKTFTQHLHQAEYMRLKALAKTRNASAASTISRPIDSITAMRAETKKRKEAEARDARNKAALEQLKIPAMQAQRQKSESDLSDFDVEGRDGGHWKGTALQGLLTTGARKNQTSLTGLQNVKSSTRAAAGFSKAENRPAHHAAKTFDLVPEPRLKKQIPPKLSETSTSEGSETDDLDAPAPERHTPAPKPLPKPDRKPLEDSLPRSTKPPLSSISFKSREKSKRNTPCPPLPSHKTGSTAKTSKHVMVEPNSDSDSSSPRASSRFHEGEAARQRLKARMVAREERRNRKSEIGGNSDEIPVFMV